MLVLGNRSAGRCLLVSTAVTAGLVFAARAVLPLAAEGWAARDSLDDLPFDRALLDLTGATLLGCLVWAWTATTVTVLEALLGAAPRGPRPWTLPPGLRRLVLTACGISLVAGAACPAYAAGGTAHGHAHHLGHGAERLTGLPLPDRAVAPPIAPRVEPPATTPAGPVAPTVVVRAGDSLWSIAAATLPAGASDSRVSARWHQIYAANHHLIGPDPDLLLPGQCLDLPRKDRP